MKMANAIKLNIHNEESVIHSFTRLFDFLKIGFAKNKSMPTYTNNILPKILIAAITSLSASIAMAQSQQMSNPDILGLKIGMQKSDALSMIKSRFPKSKISTTTKEVVIGEALLMYEAHYIIKLDKSKVRPGISEDTISISFLPNNEIVAVKRVIRYEAGKQKGVDISSGLEEKYGKPVYFVYDHSKYADQSMWSDRMLPGLGLVGMDYVQGHYFSPSDFGTVRPYPYCWSQMLEYTTENFSPASIYNQLTQRNSVALTRSNKWKVCGKALWVANVLERPLYYNTTQTEMILMDLSTATDKILNLPQQLKDNSKTIYAIPVEGPYGSSENAPAF